MSEQYRELLEKAVRRGDMSRETADAWLASDERLQKEWSDLTEAINRTGERIAACKKLMGIK